MEASEYIQIDKIKGEENKFIIDPLIDGGFDSNDDDELYLKKLKDEFNSLLKTYKDTTVKVKKNLEPCEKIKALIIKNKKLGVKISSTIIQKFKFCKVMRVHYKKLREDVEYKKSQYEKLKKKVFSSGVNVMDSKITVKQPLKGFNHILYKLNDPKREMELRTNESMNKKIFKLMEDEDGVLKIVNKD